MEWSRSGNDGVSTVLLIAGTLVGLLCPDGGQAAAALPDVSTVRQRMIERAQTVAHAEHGPPYTCEKRSVLQQLDASGKVVKSEEKTYEVTLIAGFPFNRLVKVGDRDLTGEELKNEQRKEEQFRQKFTSVDARQMAARKEGWVTPELLDRYEFAVTERIILSNRATLVITFKPKEGKLPVKSIHDHVLNRLAGTVWIDEKEADTARLSVRLVEPISLGWFGILGSLKQCELSLERQRMPDGVWVNARQVLLIQARKLAATKHFRKTEESGEFKRVDVMP